MSPRWEDFREVENPWRGIFQSYFVLATIRYTVTYLLVVGASIACLVWGTTLARYIGAVLLVGCLLVGVRVLRGRRG
jgi:hypothetical protein